MKNGFDRLAAPYRWMEYLTFGRALERCRNRFLPEFAGTQSALLLGDGDGRFAAHLLLVAPLAQVHALDGSAAMLAALRCRCGAAGKNGRLTVYCTDLTKGLSAVEDMCFDLVTTHFFLDCLSQHEANVLVSQVTPLLTREARWVVSEFNIPAGWMRVPARLLVWCLYAAFRLFTGLRVRQLPDHHEVFYRHGYKRLRCVPSLGELLLSEVWTRADS